VTERSAVDDGLVRLSIFLDWLGVYVTSAQVAFTAFFAVAEPGNRQRLRHDGFLHDAFASMPWLAWTVVGLLVVLVLLSSVGKLVGKIFRGTPWWVRLGLVGALAYAWSSKKTTQHYDARPPV